MNLWCLVLNLEQFLCYIDSYLDGYLLAYLIINTYIAKDGKTREKYIRYVSSHGADFQASANEKRTYCDSIISDLESDAILYAVAKTL